MGRTRQALMAAELPSDGTPSPVSQAWSASHKQELLVRLAREHLDHPLPAGLRQLAEEFVYAVLGLLFPHFASRGVAGRDELAAELAGIGRTVRASPDGARRVGSERGCSGRGQRASVLAAWLDPGGAAVRRASDV